MKQLQQTITDCFLWCADRAVVMTSKVTNHVLFKQWLSKESVANFSYTLCYASIYILRGIPVSHWYSWYSSDLWWATDCVIGYRLFQLLTDFQVRRIPW